jgi:hypothetical protein
VQLEASRPISPRTQSGTSAFMALQYQGHGTNRTSITTFSCCLTFHLVSVISRQGRCEDKTEGDLCHVNEGVGGRRAVGQGRDGGWWWVLQKWCEHIIGRLSKVVRVCHLWERDNGWKPFDGEGVANAGRAWNIAFEAFAVIGGRADVPTLDAVGHEGGALRWGLVDKDKDAGAARCQEGCVKIEIAKEGCVGADILGCLREERRRLRVIVAYSMRRSHLVSGNLGSQV